MDDGFFICVSSSAFCLASLSADAVRSHARMNSYAVKVIAAEGAACVKHTVIHVLFVQFMAVRAR